MEHAGILAVPRAEQAHEHGVQDAARQEMPECGNKALIRKDGCDFCTDCGFTGACG